MDNFFMYKKAVRAMDEINLKNAPEMARWNNTHCPNAVYWLGLVGW